MMFQIELFIKHHDPAVEEYVEKRLHHAVGKYQSRLRRIEVRLTDENAGKGGLDKTCSLDAVLVPRGTLHVHATEVDYYEAIVKASHRLETVLAKAVDRGHRSSSVRHQQGGLRHESNRIVDQISENQ